LLLCDNKHVLCGAVKKDALMHSPLRFSSYIYDGMNGITPSCINGKTMTEQILKQQEPRIQIEHVTEHLSTNDLGDLCDATDAAIEDGGGFGWVHVPERASLERYWQGVITAPTRWLFTARLDNVICGSAQLILPAGNNEAQGHVVQLTTNFIAPWARGHGIARRLLDNVEAKANNSKYAVINLDVRATMERAIALYESMGYVRFGEHPYSVRAHGETIASYYYYKNINPAFFTKG
jgi:ribosomal protein S18 acetylase RimI-like enzyme